MGAKVDGSTIRLDTELLGGLERFRRQQSDGGIALSREDAANVILRDWLQGQGYLPIPGDKKHTTAAAAAKVPGGHLDP